MDRLEIIGAIINEWDPIQLLYEVVNDNSDGNNDDSNILFN